MSCTGKRYELRYFTGKLESEFSIKSIVYGICSSSEGIIENI